MIQKIFLQDSKVHIYSFSGSALSETKVLTHAGPITAVAFNDSGEFLAATDTARKVSRRHESSSVSNDSSKHITILEKHGAILENNEKIRSL